MKRTLSSLLSFVLLSASVCAEEVPPANGSATVPLVPMRMGDQNCVEVWMQSQAIELTHAEATPLSETLLVIEKPPVTTMPFQLEGEISYTDVASAGPGAEAREAGYLQAVAEVPFGDPLEVRTTGSEGPVQQLRGSSDWQAFGLEFYVGTTFWRPSRLVLKVVLPGQGTVRLRKVRLIQANRPGSLSPAQAEEIWRHPELLQLEHTGSGPLTKNLLALDAPPVTEKLYQLEGEVAYVVAPAGEERGFLEMWNQFPKEGRAFSRTLAFKGGMAALVGSSDWRSFRLPFDARGATTAPSLLEFNVHVPGPASVWLRNLRLVQLKDAPALAMAPAAETAPVVDAAPQSTAPRAHPPIDWRSVASGVAALVLLSVGWEVAAFRGRSPHLVVWGARILSLAGVLALLSAAIALSLGRTQPLWHVLLFGGVWCVLWFPSRLRHHQQQHRAVELRRMSAADAI